MELCKVKEVVAKMTLEEKASLCSGLDFWHTKGVERLQIPSVMVSDGPHGLRKQEEDADHLGLNKSIKAVCFPAGCAMAASFSREAAARLGEILGEECQAEDISTILGPAMNIKRSPLCGRNFEYYSEDPLLSGMMAASVTKGVQSHHGRGVTLKHFACNNQEDNRMGVNVRVAQRALREIYLRGFEIAVKKSRPVAMMSAYNRINGVHAANSLDLCTTAARGEWGFEGIIMSDWNTTVPEDGSVPWQCIAAGNDIIMPGNQKDDEEIRRAYEQGELTEEMIRRSAGRLFAAVRRLTDKI